MNTQLTRSSTAVTALATAAILAYKQEGITTAVTRYGEAPLFPFREGNFIYKTLEPEQLRSLPKEAQRRVQILDDYSIPYTELIIAHEVPKVSKPLIDPNLVHDVITGMIYGVAVVGGVLALIASAGMVVGLVLLGIIGATAFSGMGVRPHGHVGWLDPILYARLPDGEWLEIAMWYE